MADTFFSDITDKININVLSVCDSLNNYRDNVLLGDSIKFNYNTKNNRHDPKSNKQ